MDSYPRPGLFAPVIETAESNDHLYILFNESYHITGANGARSGYAYEYEQAVAGYTGWRYEYIKGD